MTSVVQQDDGTYDIVGVSKTELDILTTFFGAVKPTLPSDVDALAYELYRAIRTHGDYHTEWVELKSLEMKK